MYSLVKFLEDQVVYVCQTKKLRNTKGSVITAPFKSLGYFEAKLICSHDSRKFLNAFLDAPKHVIDQIALNNFSDIIGTSCNDSSNSGTESGKHILPATANILKTLKFKKELTKTIDTVNNQTLELVNEGLSKVEKINVVQSNEVINEEAKEEDKAQNEELICDDRAKAVDIINTQFDEIKILEAESTPLEALNVHTNEVKREEIDEATNTVDIQTDEVVSDEIMELVETINEKLSAEHTVDSLLSTSSEFYDSDADPKCIPSGEESDGKENADLVVNSTPLQFDTATGIPQEPPKFSTKPLNQDVATSECKETKKQFCLYCRKLVCRLPRHLESMHKNEVAVKQCVALPKGNPERKKILDTIRKRGNFIFNTNASYNDGSLIVCRRPQTKKHREASHFTVCPECKGFYTKLAFRQHYRVCCPSPNRSVYNTMILCRRVHGQVHKNACSLLKEKIFPVFRDDIVSRIVRYDDLIISYGNKLCAKYPQLQHHAMIRTRIRFAGKLLLTMKTLIPEIQEFADILVPQHYDNIITAIKDIAGYDEQLVRFRAPSTAVALTNLCKSTATIWTSECIKREDEKGLKLVKNFYKLFKEGCGTAINKTVFENQLEFKRHKNKHLPSMEDIKKLNTYLYRNRQKCLKYLNEKPFVFSVWKDLASFTLTSIQVFNRRRAGEIERIQISDFLSFEAIDKQTHPAMYESLSQEGRESTKQYVRFVIRGKLARGVPVLLHTELKQCLEKVIHLREQAGVPEDNPFAFGLPGSDRHRYLSACTLMRLYSEKCGADQPALLRGTKLRKHIATQSVFLDLKEHEVSDLASFMGHADKIHRDHYRMPVIARDINVISRLLEYAQGVSDPLQEEVETDEGHPSTSKHNGNTIYRKKDKGSSGTQLWETEVAVEEALTPTKKSDFESKSKEYEEKQEDTRNIKDLDRTPTKCRAQGKKHFGEKSRKKRIELETDSDSDEIQVPQNEEKEPLEQTAANWRVGRKSGFIKENKKRNVETDSDTDSYVSELRTPPKHRKRVPADSRQKWHTPEHKIFINAFGKHLKNGTLPSASECSRVISRYPILGKRTGASLKTRVRNIQVLNRRERFRNREEFVVSNRFIK